MKNITLLKITNNLLENKLTLWLIAVSSLLWLTIAIPFLSLHNDGIKPFFSPTNKGNQDLANYYMAGSIVIADDFESLYPYPKDNIKHNVGWPDCSDVKPGYAALAKKKGVEDSFRFILPPPSAPLFVPIALLPYPLARWIWVCFLGLCVWGCCATSYHIARNGGGSRAAGVFWWATWAFSPLVLKAMRTANATPILALAMGIAAVGIYIKKTAIAIAGCLVAGLLKGTSIIFAPLLLFTKRFAIIGWGMLAVILVNLLTLFFSGSMVYQEFFTVVYPSTQLIDPYIDNQSVWGFLYRLLGETLQDNPIQLAVKTAGLSLTSFFTFLLWRVRHHLSTNLLRFNASVIGLAGLYLIFRPYNWGHYALCFVPFTATLWIGLRHSFQKILMVAAVALLWMPWVGLSAVHLSGEPLTSHMLGGEILLITIAMHIALTKEKPPTG